MCVFRETTDWYTLKHKLTFSAEPGPWRCHLWGRPPSCMAPPLRTSESKGQTRWMISGRRVQTCEWSGSSGPIHPIFGGDQWFLGFPPFYPFFYCSVLFWYQIASVFSSGLEVRHASCSSFITSITSPEPAERMNLSSFNSLNRGLEQRPIQLEEPIWSRAKEQ